MRPAYPPLLSQALTRRRRGRRCRGSRAEFRAYVWRSVSWCASSYDPRSRFTPLVQLGRPRRRDVGGDRVAWDQVAIRVRLALEHGAVEVGVESLLVNALLTASGIGAEPSPVGSARANAIDRLPGEGSGQIARTAEAVRGSADG